MTHPPKLHPLEAAALAVLFSAAISLPLVKWLVTGEPDTSPRENRTLAPRPVFAGKWKYMLVYVPQQCDAWFADHFGLRSQLLQAGSVLSTDWFRYSSHALVGKDGWFFYKVTPPVFVESLSDKTLEKWKNYLENRQQWLAARGIKYLFVVPADKDSIYPEFLPPTAGQPPATLPVDQLARYLAETHSTVKILSLRQPLLDAKKIEGNRLFYKQDGHWNSVGAFYGYQAIIRRLSEWFPALKPESRSAYRVIFAREQKRDVAHMAGLPESAAVEGPVLQSLSPVPFHFETEQGPTFGVSPFATVLQNPAGLPRAVMAGDSFSRALMPYLSLNFSRITYLSPEYALPLHGATAKILADDKPDVFIEERIQRFLPDVPGVWNVFDSAPSP